MNTRKWVKPGLYGAAAGAAALAIIGFAWGGWMTVSSASKMATERARAEVVTALLPICIDQSTRDPQISAKVAGLKDAQYYDRSDLLMKTGWATMPGATEPDRRVAAACVEFMAGVFLSGPDQNY